MVKLILFFIILVSLIMFARMQDIVWLMRAFVTVSICMVIDELMFWKPFNKLKKKIYKFLEEKTK